MQLPCLVTCSALLLYTVAVAADEVILRNNEAEAGYEDERSKRPFCNAFTGCGRKRADPGVRLALPLVAQPLRSEDPMTTLLDLNAEPAVADLSRQILSEAKLWEAIQEARDEMGRRHKEETSHRIAGLRSFRKRRSLAAAQSLEQV